MRTNRMSPMFAGSLAALVTPFKNGELDEDGLRSNVRFQIEEGTHGLVAIATTGESPTLSEAEKEKVVRICLEESGRRVPVVVSTGTNSTLKTVEATKRAEDQGADGVLVITPYYNRPTPETEFDPPLAAADHPFRLF